MRRVVQPVAFRLYPEARRGLYMRVCVWPSARDMRAYAKRTGDEDSAKRTCHGYCACYIIASYKYGTRRVDPMFAEVNLYAGKGLTMRIVTHELFHATIQYGRRIGFAFTRFDAPDSINDDEERLTHAHSTLCSDFMVRACALGLYGREHR